MLKVEEIPTLSEAELDALPEGVIQLDRSGKILYYNHAQTELARRTATATVGLNFFTEVAPCAAVQAFQGRFNDFVAKPETSIEPFSFEFSFPWGVKRVSISMVKTSDPESSVYIVVTLLESASLFAKRATVV